ncbi:MAG: DUF2206 domain-containing protein [Dehalococcoidia bacterium]|nr:DUF2206 domain-containing protein [Dehalococcoidia bacterium]
MSPVNWPIREFIFLCAGLLIASVAALALNILILRQLLLFAVLTLLPGLIILRILRIHNINTVEGLLYAVGLSLIFDLFIGALLNFILPLFKVGNPITIVPATTLFFSITAILTIIVFFVDRAYGKLTESQNATYNKADNNNFWVTSNSCLLASLLPLLAVLGTSLVNRYENTIILFALIVLIMAIIILACLTRFPARSSYPYMLFMMATALILQTTLISSNIIGTDSHLEYYHANIVIEKGYWDATVPALINSCMSITILAPIYSIFLNLDVIWVHKIVFPLLFAVAPIALYRSIRIQMGPKAAFISCVFFVTMPMFTMDMAQLNRQQISELFFCLVILLLVDRKMSPSVKTLLIVLFGMGVVVSYYGLGTGFIGYLIFSSILVIFLRSRWGIACWQFVIGRGNALPEDIRTKQKFLVLSLLITCILSTLFMVIYYRSVAGGSGMAGSIIAIHTANVTVTQTGQIGQPATSLFNLGNKEPLTQTAVGFDFTIASTLGKTWRIFQYCIQLILVIGLLALIFRPGKTIPKLKIEYLSLIIVSCLILLGLFILPTSSYGLGTSRVFQITLLLISPMFVLGVKMVGQAVNAIWSLIIPRVKSSLFASQATSLLILVIFIPYYFFNSGVVFELSRLQPAGFIDIPYAISLSNYRTYLVPDFNKADIISGRWLINTASPQYTIMADYNGTKLFSQQGTNYSQQSIRALLSPTDTVTPPAYLCLISQNTSKEILCVSPSYAARQLLPLHDFNAVNTFLQKGNFVYSNNYAKIFGLEEQDLK